MAKISPFCAIRPVADKVSLVTSRSYEEYSAAELASQLDFNPFSFLHILNAAYTNLQKIGFEKRFKMVQNKYLDFKSENYLIQEDKPSFYLYQIQSKISDFIGIIASTSIEDYQNNIIKKHEDTLKYRVELFKDFVKQTGFNTEPVLITYPDDIVLNQWIENKSQLLPLYEFSTTKKEKHTIWKIDAEADIDFLKNKFNTIGNLYIADGHHRTASAELLFNEIYASKQTVHDYFMSYLIAESKVKIYEFNRIIRDLNHNTKESFLEKLSDKFWVKNKGQEIWKPTKKFEFGMYIDSEFYSLQFKDIHNFNTVLDALDAQILYENVLLPILGIEDLRNDDRIDYIPGNQSILNLKEIIDDNEYAIGFVLFPTAIHEIKALADNNYIMPPKSTYIEPKFRSGLFVYEY